MTFGISGPLCVQQWGPALKERSTRKFRLGWSKKNRKLGVRNTGFGSASRYQPVLTVFGKTVQNRLTKTAFIRFFLAITTPRYPVFHTFFCLEVLTSRCIYTINTRTSILVHPWRTYTFTKERKTQETQWMVGRGQGSSSKTHHFLISSRVDKSRWANPAETSRVPLLVTISGWCPPFFCQIFSICSGNTCLWNNVPSRVGDGWWNVKMLLWLTYFFRIGRGVPHEVERRVLKCRAFFWPP